MGTLKNICCEMNSYDYIIAGAGCAGLSLAYHISKSSLQNKSILLIDKASKTENDRTWCFWEKEPNLFENIVYRKWRKVDFYGADFADSLDLGKYGINDQRYRLLPVCSAGIVEISQHKNCIWNIISTYNTENGAAVVVTKIPIMPVLC
jgi:hypothetical protein